MSRPWRELGAADLVQGVQSGLVGVGQRVQVRCGSSSSTLGGKTGIHRALDDIPPTESFESLQPLVEKRVQGRRRLPVRQIRPVRRPQLAISRSAHLPLPRHLRPPLNDVVLLVPVTSCTRRGFVF